jgi:small-conductance mechanosensitive channel
MSKRPLRVTGFTRFFIVMLFVVPLAYLGASYYNGQDGLQNIKDFLGIEQKDDSSPASSGERKPVKQTPANDVEFLEAENRQLREELDFKTKKVEELYLENEQLKRKLQSLEETVKEVKNQ